PAVPGCSARSDERANRPPPATHAKTADLTSPPRALIRSGQPADLDRDAQVAARRPVVDALQRGHVVVVAPAGHHHVLGVGGAAVGRVVADPVAAPPLHPRVALAFDGAAD